ncbi:protein bfr2-like [Patiria miniata]|uniref:Uncharacterized protein n=1 Tax=Patiria miniata TaxID=46514 RepID=A0A914AHH6_PATMI|nr:protein bfr2-like [Patiria miniata]
MLQGLHSDDESIEGTDRGEDDDGVEDRGEDGVEDGGEDVDEDRDEDVDRDMDGVDGGDEDVGEDDDEYGDTDEYGDDDKDDDVSCVQLESSTVGGGDRSRVGNKDKDGKDANEEEDRDKDQDVEDVGEDEDRDGERYLLVARMKMMLAGFHQRVVL